MLLHSTSYISADFTLYPSYVVFAVIVFGDFYVGAFLRFCVIIIVEIVDETVVMVPNCTAELNTLMNELEMNELEPTTGVLTAQAYMRLLAVYLHQNDLYNAKYLWQRIPSDMKATHEDLRRIWIVGQRMWQRNWPAVHAALNVEWGEDVKNIMTALKDHVRERVMRLISKAYSSLNLTTMATMSGMSLDEARQAAIDRGWTVDGTIVQPCKQIDEEQYNQSDKICLTEEQLEKLTQFVSFLEN